MIKISATGIDEEHGAGKALHRARRTVAAVTLTGALLVGAGALLTGAHGPHDFGWNSPAERVLAMDIGWDGPKRNLPSNPAAERVVGKDIGWNGQPRDFGWNAPGAGAMEKGVPTPGGAA
ncbi:putative Early nodulin-like protein 2 [Streptomyces afghaniensis 772]|uniref:Putative Early nodulin-like protein 2 n=1 Tax=Streptomyces afghaniensis 772 TaxID=1283301 RepID=S4MVT4_9ACTN|nr:MULTISPECIES: hypothetical protein [Streptomyces]EPJ39910.1 putative Early nodulin-like protein 2 [Streptomyces afghaniensis 772]UOB13290.1 hypothetical protein MQE23_31470 [Streptomyces sp. HP-A2021]